MRTPFVAGQGVDFVDNDGADTAENLAAFGSRQKQVKRFGSRNENVGRPAKHCLAVASGSVARSHRNSYGRQLAESCFSFRGDFFERNLQVTVDVIAERLQRGNIENLRFVRQGNLGRLSH